MGNAEIRKPIQKRSIEKKEKIIISRERGYTLGFYVDGAVQSSRF